MVFRSTESTESRLKDQRRCPGGQGSPAVPCTQEKKFKPLRRSCTTQCMKDLYHAEGKAQPEEGVEPQAPQMEIA